MTADGRVAVVTGATQGLGLALVGELAQRLNAEDTVCLTGRNDDRISEGIESMGPTTAEVRGAVLDVGQPSAPQRFAVNLEWPAPLGDPTGDGGKIRSPADTWVG